MRVVSHSALPSRTTVFGQARLAQNVRRPSSNVTQRFRRLQVQAVSDSGGLTETDEDLEAAMEDFLRKQAEKESGSLLAQPAAPVTEVVGSDVVTDEEAKRYCREVVRVLKELKETRDMSVAEVKLTLAIEDMSVREQKEYMGIEDERGASRDEMAAALVEVADGRVPKDRIALRELYAEMIQWPFVGSNEAASPSTSSPGPSPYETITKTGAEGTSLSAAGWRPAQARPKMMGRDKSEEPQSLIDTLPDWVGYGLLYFISVIPVLIAGSVIAILFFNSLR
ncbi:Ycf3-interacting protein 1, chloroplastic [Coccomyxa sp. Obi]|nr:Ycf3-interacting protein 1, chloroplastic [Coccomyxa sp. Obi]